MEKISIRVSSYHEIDQKARLFYWHPVIPNNVIFIYSPSRRAVRF